jgi:hypothetical protein
MMWPMRVSFSTNESAYFFFERLVDEIGVWHVGLVDQVALGEKSSPIVARVQKTFSRVLEPSLASR